MKRLLIIEDEESVRSSVAQRLELEGFEVSTAANGGEGLALARQLRPDLILCDILMPDLDGYSVVSRLKSDPELSEIPVILLTALSGPDHVRQGMNVGADDYLTKPFSNSDLLAAIRSRLSRSETQQANTQRRMNVILDSFGSLMHELRGPICAAVSCAESLPTESPGSVSSGSADPVRMVRSAAPTFRRLAALTQEVMTYARLRHDRLPFRPEPMDLVAVCAEIIATFPDASRISLEAFDSPLLVVADRRMCGYIVHNLLDNALKFSPGHQAVHLCLSADAATVTLEVLDHGIGLPDDARCQVFLPFYRAANVTGIPGTGLGLPLVLHCVEQHGGRVEVADSPSGATCFRVLLPRKQGSVPMASPGIPPAPSHAASAATGTAVGGRGTPKGPSIIQVLLVDDEPLARETLRAQLAAAPEFCVVGEASSLAEARAVLSAHPVNVVFLDIRLPDGLGFELVENLPPSTKVVFTSAFDEYLLDAFRHRPIAFLPKPVDPRQLAPTLDDIRRDLATERNGESAKHKYTQQTLVVPHRTGTKVLRLPQVNILLANGEYSTIQAVGGESFMMRKPLDAWERELPYPFFVRAHRGAIINVAHIEKTARLPNRRLTVSLRGVSAPIVASARLSPKVKRAVRDLARLSARA